MKEPLQKARETNDELKRQLANYEKDKRCLKSSQTRLAAQKEEMKELKWEHEVIAYAKITTTYVYESKYIY